MTQTDAVIGVYRNHFQAEELIKKLDRAGFELDHLSIVGTDYHTEEHVTGYYNTGDRMEYWGKMGAFWGGVWGWLVGAAFFAIPGIGPVLVAGPLVGWIVGALEGAVVVGGVSALGAGLFSIGIPKNTVLESETAVKAGQFVVIAHGSPSEVERARDIIAAVGSSHVHIHQNISEPSATAA